MRSGDQVMPTLELAPSSAAAIPGETDADRVVSEGGALPPDVKRIEVGLYRLIAGWTFVYAAASWLLEYLYSRLGVRHPDPVAVAVKCWCMPSFGPRCSRPPSL